MTSILSQSELWARLQQKSSVYQQNYLAMYSSYWDGIVCDPRSMLLPIDEHMVHRGDGIFEAIKTKARKIYLLDEHLARLARSAAAIDLKLPMSLEQIKEKVIDTLKAADKENCLIRLFVGRGPGGFTANPYETIGSQLYIVVTEFKPMEKEKYQNGVSLKLSQVPAKDSWSARIKSCNYLLNVLLKKDAVDSKVDFAIGMTSDGWLTEGATENIAFVNQAGEFCYPKFDYTLKGTTLVRVAELAKKLVTSGELKGVKEINLTKENLLSAKEVFMIGTTLDVLPVSLVEQQKITVGPVGSKLLALLHENQKTGDEY